ncbi:MAG: nicotinamide-nucleotide amidohydrolase family protein [Candidatus Competibacteraceae bacterium]|jgi:nicotinamide-nucleotide amidase|nr:nicotinamide-nucleotide amidohydrolase family protein [Candidatus Competibacteraceae bacterium]
MSQALPALVNRVGQALLARNWMLVAAESCTGGWIAKVITDLPGSSRWFERGFVTYSNAAKVELLGVQETTLAAHGAVSAATVDEMTQGALVLSHAQVAVAVSGIAGPDGGGPDKPVGTVWLGWMLKDGAPRNYCYQFNGDREAVRLQAVVAALEGIVEIVDGRDPG